MGILNRSKIKQILVYLLVGGGTALLELAIFSLLYRLFLFDVSVSNVIAVLIATATNFMLNGTVTFKGSSNIYRSVILYTALFIFNTFFSTAAITMLSQAGAPAELVKVGTMVCIVIWNYVLYRKIVFR